MVGTGRCSGAAENHGEQGEAHAGQVERTAVGYDDTDCFWSLFRRCTAANSDGIVQARPGVLAYGARQLRWPRTGSECELEESARKPHPPALGHPLEVLDKTSLEALQHV